MAARDIMHNLLLLVGAMLVFFLVFEVVLRVFDVRSGQRDNEFAFYEYNETLGWKNKPGVFGMFHMADGTNDVRINSLGLRDREYSYEKPNGTTRIVALGDSHTWGFGINNSERYTEILEKELGVDVINMGVAGYGTDQEYLTLQYEGIRYEPDIILLGLHVGSDVDDNNANVRYGYPKPQFVIQDGELELVNVPVPLKKDWEARVYENEPLYRRVDRLLQHVRSYSFIRNGLLGFDVVRTMVVGWEEKKPASADVTKALLVGLKNYAAAKHARLMIVVIPTRNQVAGGNVQLNEELVLFMQKNGIVTVDLLPIFKSQTGDLYFRIDTHWNVLGNNVTAEAISAKMKELRWVNVN